MLFVRIFAFFALSCIVFGSTAHAAACLGGALLNGAYGFIVSGASSQGGYGEYESGVVNFNGACHITGTATGGENGTVSTINIQGNYGASTDSSSPNAIMVQFGISGTSDFRSFTVAIAPKGKTGYGLQTDTTSVATITLTPINYAGPFTKATLNGTYVFNCSGNETEFSDLNYLTFDGNGNITGYDIFNNVGYQGTVPVTGVYKVTSDGRFSATLTQNFQGYYMAGVMINGTKGITFIYYETPQGAITACRGTQ